MPQLDPTFFASQLFWLAITFVMLYFVLSRMVLPPLLEILARRQQTMEGDIGKAERLRSEAEEARIDYERTLLQARSSAQQVMIDTAAEQKAKAEQAGKELDAKIERKLADAGKQIEAKKQELLSALAPAASDLTALIVEKLTQHKPGNDQVSRILSELAKGRR